jgi:thiol-disulfide isomerase/thioredoxin
MPRTYRNKKALKRSKKSRRHHKVQSTVGNILPPIDVRSPKDIPGFMKRVLSGPVTIVLVYADWCGHCVEFMPKFKTMIRSPDRTTQVASIESSMEKQVKEALQKNNSAVTPMNVDGYPTTLVMDKNGNSLKTIPRESLSTVLKEGGPLAEESISSPVPSMKMPSPSPSPMPTVQPMPNIPPMPSSQPPNKTKTQMTSDLDVVHLPKVNHIGGSLYKKMVQRFRQK